mmetsp:Transcript_13174/g.28348  ORF Transcript_13174/g.28348 Transcript_13174/m.28348 type:complete len:162 (-) Transcript_13174:1028-1513(-)
MAKPNTLLFSFPGEHVQAKATLNWDLCPETCRAVTEHIRGRGHTATAVHGKYSGSECLTVLDAVFHVQAENASSKVCKGDVAFAVVDTSNAHGALHAEDFAEICWFYDNDAEPRNWVDGASTPADVNRFAKFVAEESDAFFAVCRRIWREGEKPLRIELGD